MQAVDLTCEKYTISKDEVSREIAEFEAAVEKVNKDLSELALTDAIFEGHLAIVNDFSFADGVKTRISELTNVQTAISETVEEVESEFEKMDDEYIRERAADVADVGNRLLAVLQNKSLNKFASIRDPVIVVADDLAPSDMAMLDLNKVKGFITERGGVTSHVCIMSHNMGVPALVGVQGILKKVTSGDLVAMDAFSGEILVNPDEKAVKEMLAKKQMEENRTAVLKEKAALPAVSVDGHQVKVYANVGNLEDVDRVLKFSAEGVGLFRSEFIFMENDHFPSEEEQFEIYRQAVTRLNRELIIRTLDIGADKKLSYYQFPQEGNPYLGWRAVRVCLDKKDMFKAQLRALLRASAFGTIKVMVPMIISCEELDQVNALMEICKAELSRENKEFNPELSVGVMIETPAAVLCADLLAQRADFFSIGTNDLTQYVLAVDRGNEAISSLYNSFHPAVLRAVAQVIKAGHQAGIEVGMCGEFAGNPKATEILLGLGLDEFSMAASETPVIKDIVRNLDYKKAVQKAERVLNCFTVKEVTDILN